MLPLITAAIAAKIKIRDKFNEFTLRDTLPEIQSMGSENFDGDAPKGAVSIENEEFPIYGQPTVDMKRRKADREAYSPEEWARDIRKEMGYQWTEMIDSHIDIYQIAIPQYWEMIEKGKNIIVYGRDCYYMHKLMKSIGLPHIYVEGVSRNIMNKRRLVKYIVQEVARQNEIDEIRAAEMIMNSVHVDTGFRGSVPMAICNKIKKIYGIEWNVEMKMLSADIPNNGIKGYCEEYQRMKVLEIEHSPKKYLRVVELESDGSPKLVRSADWALADLLLEDILKGYNMYEDIPKEYNDILKDEVPF